jgi:glycosyltransferase involved in cell wall biosynthesis
VIEYLEMGLPVVASDLPGTREAVAGRAAVSLVPPGDPTAAAAVLERMLAGGEARRAAAAQAPALRESLVWPDEEVRGVYRAVAGVMRN